MARKRATSGPTSQVLSRFQANVKQLQHDAEQVLGRTRRQAERLISQDQKRAVDKLIGQAQRLRADLEKRAQRASKGIEARAERFLNSLEKETANRLKSLLRRLDLPSRKEVESLMRRIAKLEKEIEAAAKKTADPTASTTEIE
jgi:F0F1-type ATP synthase membrane subunit b/b'